jgi:hypothetical protein
MYSLWSYFTFHHLIIDTDICKSSTCHNEIITTSSPVGVEVLLLHTVLLQVSTSRWTNRDISSRWNMIGCYRITKYC